MLKEYQLKCTLFLQVPEGYEEKVKKVLEQCSGMLDLSTDLIVPAFIGIPEEKQEIELLLNDLESDDNPELEQQLKMQLDQGIEKRERLYGSLKKQEVSSEDSTPL